MARDVAFIFTGLDRRCAEFDLDDHSIKKALYNRFDTVCFPVDKYLVPAFETGGKARLFESMKKTIMDHGDPAVLILAHSYGCILAIQLAQQLFETGKKKVCLVLLDPTTSTGLLKKLPIEFTTLLESALTGTSITFDYPTLVITYFNISDVLNKIFVANNLKKLQNRSDLLQFKTALGGMNLKIDKFLSMLGENTNINVHILPILPEDEDSHVNRAHFLHLNDPDRILKEINQFISLVIPKSYGVAGGRRRTRRRHSKTKTRKNRHLA